MTKGTADLASVPERSACLTDDQISQWVDGVATPDQVALFALHTSECESCATLAGLMGALDAFPVRGARVGRYEILERIGSGSMGVVYAARDPALDRKVALKLIRPQVAGPELEARLLREAKAMARVTHPAVISVYDAGRDGDRLFIAMELIDGGTLREWLVERPRSWREILAVYVRAGRGLAQAHALGLVHRDFKPDNVLVGKDGGVRVTDFGLARSAEATDAPSSSRPAPPAVDALEATSFAPLTRTGALVGTPAYMAPEQLSGAPADVRSDAYAFCVALWEALYGDRPFGGTTLLAHRQMKEVAALPAPSSERGVPARVRRVLVAGLSPKPEQRHAGMAHLLDALERAARWPLATPEHPSASIAVLVAMAIAVGAVGTWLQPRAHVRHGPDTGVDSAKLAAAALAGGDGRLACPIFEVRGIADVAVRVGAAAATLACARAAWELGGNDDRVLPPAALLDVPRQPADEVPDQYESPAQRARTLASARARAAAYIDGSVTYERDAWTVELVVRAPDDREVVRSKGEGGALVPAVRSALEGLWKAPLVRRPIDPDVARWTGLPDAEAGVLQTDVTLLLSTARCDELAAHRGKDANASLFLQKICEYAGAHVPADAGAPSLDESSPEALVTSVRALAAWEIPLPMSEERRLAMKLEALGVDEKSAFGRGRLAYAAGLLWSLTNERERAAASLRVSLREDPLSGDAWELVLTATSGAGAPLVASTSSVARAWLPYESRFVAKADSWRGDELDARLRDTRLAYLLTPRLAESIHLGRALAEAGRAEDVRAVAATPLGDPEQNRVLGLSLLAFVEMHEAKVERAIPHLEGAEDLLALVVVADVAGRSEEVATRWATRFVALPDDQAEPTARAYHTPMILCMRARGPLAARCLDRIARIGRAGMNWWYEGGTALLAGARRYAAGDVRGAVSAWRSLVACPNLEIVRALPTEAFERAGEPALAALLDERKLPFTPIAGVSDAAPREAKRALAAGDVSRAREIASAVVKGWEVADAAIPAVAEMRALLAKTDARGSASAR